MAAPPLRDELDVLQAKTESSCVRQPFPETDWPVRLLTQEEAEAEDRTYWHSKTPAQRMAAAEQLRQAAFGYDPATARIQAIAQIINLQRR